MLTIEVKEAEPKLPDPTCPLMGNPYRLVNLREMVRIIAAEIIAIFPNLTELNLGYGMGGEDAPTPEEYKNYLDQLIRLCNLIGWKDLSAQGARLLERAKRGEDGAAMEALTEDLRDAFVEKSASLHSILIEERDSALFVDAVAEVCGSNLHVDLSVPAEEFNLAGRALAVGLSTASVAHSMRAIEASLHALCRTLGVTFPGSIEVQDWKVLTEKITSEIKSWENRSRSPEKTEQLKRMGELLVPADGFRLAWRNHVAHAREKYEEDEARTVLRHAGDFLHKLSEGMAIVP